MAGGRNYQNLFLRDIIGDETWGYCCDPETKLQSPQWRSHLLTTKEN
jgi:hypothetical protein